MILIGSRALDYYIPLNRKLHDYDVIMTEVELEQWNNNYQHYKVKETDYSIIYDINGEIVEVRNPKHLDNTDKQLLRIYEKWEVNQTFYMFFGGERFKIPHIQYLYDIKKATADWIDEPKHKYDLKMIEEYSPLLWKSTQLYQERSKEIEERFKKSEKVKYDFFHKYHIPEYIKHDRLHEMFADLLDINIPTYQRITNAEVAISEDLFNKLTHNQKISLMVEEALVLNLERWFNPQMVENGINFRLIDKFYNNNEAMPTYLILKHVCITGLKGEAKYITSFSKENFFEIEKEWINAKEKIKSKGGFPSWFFDELFKTREEYKKGNTKWNVVT